MIGPRLCASAWWLATLLAAAAAYGQEEPGKPAAAAPAPSAAPASAAPGPAVPEPAPEKSLHVLRVHFRGNRKVEDDAIKVALRTQPGAMLTRDMLRDDVRTIWKMGFFEDVQVETTDAKDGMIVVFVLKEKPSIRKIYVAGNDEIGLSKINEVLDIKKEQILDLAKVKKNVEKIREIYLEKGFYMVEVSYELKREEPNDVDVWFRIRENAKVEVRRVNFVGNKSASDQELRDVMLTQEGSLLSFVTQAGTYREDVFQRDLVLIQSWYFDRGYINVKVGSPQLQLSPDKRALSITISVDEGQQFRLGRVDIKGDLLEDKEFFLKRLQVKEGDVFNRSKLSQDLQHLTDFYKDRGYAYVNPTPLTGMNEKERTVDLTLDIQKGEKVYIERISVHGNSKTRDKVIRREMRAYEGEPYTQSGIDISKRRVTALGFFEKVDVSTKRGSSDDQMEVNVEVAERPTGTFQIGAGFSSVENFIAQAQISQNNLFGRGTLLTLQAQLSSLRQLFLLSYQDPYFLDTDWTFGFNLFNQQLYYTSFLKKSVGGSLTWGYLFAEDARVFLTYTLQQVSVQTGGVSGLFSGGQRSPVPPGAIANLLRSGLTSAPRLSVMYDTRNDRLFPSRGWFNQVSLEIADPATLSENVYTREEAVMRFFYPLFGPFVFRLKAEAGLVSSHDPRGVPISERYFIGGIFDVRGFAPRSLGPQIRAPGGSQAPFGDLINFRVGGNMQVIGNAEIEFPIFDKVGIRGVVFTDVGNAFNLEDQYCRLAPSGTQITTSNNPTPLAADPSIDPCKHPWDGFNTLRASWGFGFRWFSPIGPLRFEWGVPYRTLPGEQPIVFEFTIGNFF